MDDLFADIIGKTEQLFDRQHIEVVDRMVLIRSLADALKEVAAGQLRLKRALAFMRGEED
jgi:hypothetical protein